jgi:hypothetical protein
MKLALAAYQNLAPAPVNIFKLNVYDLGRTEPQSGDKEQHCIIVPPRAFAKPCSA